MKVCEIPLTLAEHDSDIKIKYSGTRHVSYSIYYHSNYYAQILLDVKYQVPNVIIQHYHSTKENIYTSTRERFISQKTSILYVVAY